MKKMPQLRLLPDSFTYTALMKTGASEGGTGATSGATLWQRELVLLKNAFVSQRESEEDRRQNQKGTKQERQVATGCGGGRTECEALGCCREEVLHRGLVRLVSSLTFGRESPKRTKRTSVYMALLVVTSALLVVTSALLGRHTK